MTNRHAPPGLVVRTRHSDHQLQGETVYRIGRDPTSDIVMTDSRVSWRHGVLRIDGDAWILEDLGSTNGTFVGPERLDRIEISADCVVRLGNPDDGPVLRCMPQEPAVAAGQAVAVPAVGRPGTALAAQPAPPARKSTCAAMARRGAMTNPGGCLRPGPCHLPTASRSGRPLRRASLLRRPTPARTAAGGGVSRSRAISPPQRPRSPRRGRRADQTICRA